MLMTPNELRRGKNSVKRLQKANMQLDNCGNTRLNDVTISDETCIIHTKVYKGLQYIKKYITSSNVCPADS